MMRTLRRERHRAPILVLVPALLLAACDLVSLSVEDQASDELHAAMSLWQSAGVVEYELALERHCYCPPVGTVYVTVREGMANDVRPAEGGPLPLTDAYPDVPGLFEVVRDAQSRGAHRLRVAYHPTLGYPTEISIDYRENVADDELAYVAGLRVLGRDD